MKGYLEGTYMAILKLEVDATMIDSIALCCSVRRRTWKYYMKLFLVISFEYVTLKDCRIKQSNYTFQFFL